VTKILFNCDDFGKSHRVNQAILRAHREGVLGSASLMVTGEALQEAVEIAKENPRLKVGLHLALSEVKPALAPEQIPDLVEPTGCFPSDPGKSGIRIAFNSKARIQAAKEIEAQFQRFKATGLTPAHVDGHHHLHMHPWIFSECLRWGEALGFQRIRVVQEFADPFPPRRDSQQFSAKLARHLVFIALSMGCRQLLVGKNLESFDGVLGLWETGRMSEDYLLSAIPQLPSGRWEVYNHIGSEDCEVELQAMLSERVKKLVRAAHSILE
jgi:chitin disaccharide deacetylase